MLTHLYWLLLVLVVLAVFYLVALRLKQLKLALILVLALGLSGHLFYFFYLEQVLVKRFGGSMSLNLPQETYHLGVTWKEDNLWIHTYYPATNECVFREYSRGRMMEGEVRLRNCNPWPAPQSERPASDLPQASLPQPTSEVSQ